MYMHGEDGPYPSFSTMCNHYDHMCAVTELKWSKPLEIVKYPDPRLRAVNAKVGVFDASLMDLAKEMIQIMYM